MKVKLQEMKNFAESFLSEIKQKSVQATVVGLSGNLGAGKTTFTQHVANLLGVEEQITSPTFVIMKMYSSLSGKFKTLIHIDAYRLKSGEELETLRFKELLENPENLILIEWPEKVSDILPSDMITIEFEVVDEETREIAISN